MKNDKLLTELRRIEAGLLKSGGEASAYITLQNLITEVEGEIRDECNKQAGKSSVAKAAQRILKTAQTCQSRPLLHKAYRDKDSLTVCDGFRLVRFNLDTAPSLEEHPENYHDYINVDALIGASRDNSIRVLLTRDLVELRAYIKTEKARLKAKKEKGVRYIVTDGFGKEIHLDAEFLLDMLEALPGATVTASKQRTQTSALYFKAENGEGILLPLRQPEKKD